MGCAPSCTPSADDTSKVPSKASFVEFDPPEVVPVKIGSGVRKLLNTDKSVVFIFGGPGSQKGLVIDELRRRYDFITISTDDIVFNYLPNKMANMVEMPSDIITQLKKDPGSLSLDWLFSMISAKLSTSHYQRFIVDIVPELPSVMTCECFTNTSSHDRTLESFERRSPVIFALNLDVFDADVLGIVKGEEKKAPSDGGNSRELDNFLQGMDDIDKGRLQKRLLTYHNCSRPFLKYFSTTKRMITVTLKMTTKNAAHTVTEIFRDFGFTLQRQTHKIILFSMREHFLSGIDLDYYRLRKVRLSDICKSKQDDMISQIVTLQQFVEKNATTEDNFAVCLDTLKVTDEKMGKRIMFYSRSNAYLDEFIMNRSVTRGPTNRERLQVHVISSPGDQTLLFMEPFNESVLRSIGIVYGAD